MAVVAYSSFINSYWYTYRQRVDSKEKEEQRFCVCPIADFSYAELTSDLPGCIEKCLNIIEVNFGQPFFLSMPTEDDVQELKGYVSKFIAEVDNQFFEG